jgi:DNA-binding transcriptional LysR family regulator
MSAAESDLPVVRSLDELAALSDGRADLYIRWSKGPDADASGTSRDELTGVELPGLCANPLAVEAWWEDRPLRTWVARRIYDYRHLAERRGADVRPWILEGDELGRGPDNEPIVKSRKAIAWVADEVVAEAEHEVTSAKEDWGPLDRG